MILWRNIVAILRRVDATADGRRPSRRLVASTLANLLRRVVGASAIAASTAMTWESMWAAGLRPGQAFDVAGPSKALLRVMDTLPKGRTTLVPGAGRAYDALALSEALGCPEVVALDIAPSACAAARDWLASAPASAARDRVRVVEGDFFDVAVPDVGLVWDCTFLCALPPSSREAWAERYAALLAPGGELVQLVFPIAPSKVGGPPFHLDLAIVRGLLRGTFEEVALHELPPGTHMAGVPAGNAVVRWRRK